MPSGPIWSFSHLMVSHTLTGSAHLPRTEINTMQHISEWSMCESARTMVDQPILFVRGALLDGSARHHHMLPQRRDAAVWLHVRAVIAKGVREL